MMYRVIPRILKEQPYYVVQQRIFLIFWFDLNYFKYKEDAINHIKMRLSCLTSPILYFKG
jgi:hypothetical protein